MAVTLPQKPANVYAEDNPSDSIEELVQIIQAITPTPWEDLKGVLGAKLEEGSGKFQSVRLESNQQVARLAGAVKTKSGQKLEPGETLLTLPVGYRPARAQVIDATHGAQVANKLLIATNGVVTLAVAVAEALEVNLDGTTFPTT